MEIIWSQDLSQRFLLPRQTFEQYPSIKIGSYAEVELENSAKVIGRCFLHSPPNVDFIRLNSLCRNQAKSNLKDSKLINIQALNVIQDEECQVEIRVVCSNIKSKLDFNDEILLQALNNLVFKSGHVLDFSSDTLMKDIGVDYVVLKVIGDADSDKVFKFGEWTKVTKITTETCHRKVTKKCRLGGLTSQSTRLRTILERKQDIQCLNLKGFLISGPSGSGKSSLINNVCGDNYLVLRVQCSSLMRPHPGESEKVLKDLFDKAELHAQEGKTLLVFEDVDLIGNSTDGQDAKSGHNLRLVSHFRTLLDQFGSKNSNLIIGATTCQPINVHESLRRPGRFTHEIFIQVPNCNERAEIIKALDEHNEHSLEIAQVTQGYVASDLANLLSYMSLNKSADFSQRLQESLRMTSPSGFKSGIGSVQLTPLSWDSIGGLEEIKQSLQSAIMWPLKYPELYKKLDVKRTKGVLVHGPPGCGKTTLVRAMASMSGATFLSISAASIFSPYVGDSEKSLAQVFHKARLGAPSVLFIDEIDGMVTNRSDDNKGSGVQERVLSVLLNEMDGIGSLGHHRHEDSGLDNDVIVVGATNRAELLDAALMRPGRFDKIIYVPLPDETSRLEILRVATKHTPLSADVDLSDIASRTEGFSGADLDNACKEAALHAMTIHGLDQVQHVTQADFKHVLMEKFKIK